MKSSTSGSVNFVWMSWDRPTRSIILLQTDRTSEDNLWDKRRFSHATDQTNKLKICMIMYIKPQFITDLIQLIMLIGSTRPKFV